MRASQLGGGGLSTQALVALPPPSSLDSSFTSQGSSSASGLGQGGVGDVHGAMAQLVRFVEARLSVEQGVREGMMRDMGRLREVVAGLERERDEARGGAENLRARQTVLAQEMGFLRDRVEAGGSGGMGQGGSRGSRDAGAAAALQQAAEASALSNAAASELRMARSEVA